MAVPSGQLCHLEQLLRPPSRVLCVPLCLQRLRDSGLRHPACEHSPKPQVNKEGNCNNSHIEFSLQTHSARVAEPTVSVNIGRHSSCPRAVSTGVGLTHLSIHVSAPMPLGPSNPHPSTNARRWHQDGPHAGLRASPRALFLGHSTETTPEAVSGPPAQTPSPIIFDTLPLSSLPLGPTPPSSPSIPLPSQSRASLPGLRSSLPPSLLLLLLVWKCVEVLLRRLHSSVLTFVSERPGTQGWGVWKHGSHNLSAVHLRTPQSLCRSSCLNGGGGGCFLEGRDFWKERHKEKEEPWLTTPKMTNSI